MLTLTQAVDTFPSVRIPSHGGGLPVEVSLISQMGIGLEASPDARLGEHHFVGASKPIRIGKP